MQGPAKWNPLRAHCKCQIIAFFNVMSTDFVDQQESKTASIFKRNTNMSTENHRGKSVWHKHNFL